MLAAPDRLSRVNSLKPIFQPLTEFLFVLFVILSVGCGTQPPEVTKAPKLKQSRFPAWEPEDSLLIQLDDRIDQPEFSICPPIGFGQQHRSASRMYQWIGPRRKDRTSAVLQVVISTNHGPANLNKSLGRSLENIKRRRSDWTESELEAGEIDGHKFVKKTWRATHRTNGAVMNGVMYVGQVDDVLVQLNAQEVGANRIGNLKVCEASLLSFRLPSNPGKNADSKNRDPKNLVANSSRNGEAMPTIQANQIAKIQNATTHEIDGFKFSLPKRFSPTDAFNGKLPRRLKGKVWVVDESDPSTNALLVGLSMPKRTRSVSSRQVIVDTSAGFTDSMGIEIQQRGKTRSFDSPAGLISGFRFFGTMAKKVRVIGDTYIAENDGQTVVFITLLHEGDEKSFTDQVISGLSTLEESKK